MEDAELEASGRGNGTAGLRTVETDVRDAGVDVEVPGTDDTEETVL